MIQMDWAAAVYMPWWGLDNKNKEFPRGYHVEIGGGYGMPSVGTFHGACEMHEGYGKDLKKFVRQKYGTTVGLSGRGEMIPNDQTFMDIDPNVVDKWGIPVPRFHFKWSDHEIKMAKHMHDTFAAIFKEMGGELTGFRNDKHDNGISIGGGHHPRNRCGAYGERSKDVSAEPILSVARCEESVRQRWRIVRQQS